MRNPSFHSSLDFYFLYFTYGGPKYMRNAWEIHVFFWYFSESKNTLIFQIHFSCIWPNTLIIGLGTGISHVFLIYFSCISHVIFVIKNPMKYLKYMRNTWEIHEQIHERYIKIHVFFMYFSCISHVFNKKRWEINVYLMYISCI